MGLIKAALGAAGGKTGNEEAARLKNYLDGNLNRIVKNSELAASVYRSPDYTVKLFAAEYVFAFVSDRCGCRKFRKDFANSLYVAERINLLCGG